MWINRREVGYVEKVVSIHILYTFVLGFFALAHWDLFYLLTIAAVLQKDTNFSEPLFKMAGVEYLIIKTQFFVSPLTAEAFMHACGSRHWRYCIFVGVILLCGVSSYSPIVASFSRWAQVLVWSLCDITVMTGLQEASHRHCTRMLSKFCSSARLPNCCFYISVS